MRCSWRAIWTNNVSKKLSLSIYIQFVTCTLQIFKWYDIVPNKILLLFNSYDDKGGFLISKVRGAMPMNHEFPSASKLDSYMIWFWSIPQSIRLHHRPLCKLWISNYFCPLRRNHKLFSSHTQLLFRPILIFNLLIFIN